MQRSDAHHIKLLGIASAWLNRVPAARLAETQVSGIYSVPLLGMLVALSYYQISRSTFSSERQIRFWELLKGDLVCILFYPWPKSFPSKRESKQQSHVMSSPRVYIAILLLSGKSVVT